MVRYKDDKLDIILHEALKCSDEPGSLLNERIKAELSRRMEEPEKREISLWWLPAAGGSAITFAAAVLGSFVFQSAAMLALIKAYSIASMICIWGLTIMGIKKYGLIREAIIK